MLKNTCGCLVLVLDMLHTTMFILTLCFYEIDTSLSAQYENFILLLISSNWLLFSADKQEGEPTKLLIWAHCINAVALIILGIILFMVTMVVINRMGAFA